MIFQGPSLTQIGMNPLYRARIPSVLIVCKQTKEIIKTISTNNFTDKHTLFYINMNLIKSFAHEWDTYLNVLWNQLNSFGPILRIISFFKVYLDIISWIFIFEQWINTKVT